MNNIHIKLFRATVAAAMVATVALFPGLSTARNLVILHTNDTHSQLEPDAKGAAGILQRRAVMDSVRAAEKNIITVDAGDGVQGSLYFKFFRGDVDYPLMNMVGYDIRILGNHEFDNGLEDLARHWKNVKGERLSANYDFSNTPAKGLFKPWVIKKVDGKKIGFIGINVNPESLIIENNYKGMVYSDAVHTADSIATYLRNKQKCDLIVAVTHIGYDVDGKEDDMTLARQSKDIDIIIGGHSHTLVDPKTPEKTPSVVMNAVGKPVLIAQTGKTGKYVGKIEVDLDNLPKDGGVATYELIPVTDRFPEEKLNKEMKAFLAPYKEKVDSVNNRRVGIVRSLMNSDDYTGSMANWTADFADWYGTLILDSLRRTDPTVKPLDMAVMNVGGIRSSWPEGVLTEGMVLSTFPFSNHFVITDVKGSDLLDAMKVAAKRGGEAVSHQARFVVDADGNLLEGYLNGEPIDPEKSYRIGTIDYVAWGNDGLTGLGKGNWIFEDNVEIAAPYLRYLRQLEEKDLPVEGDSRPRFSLTTR